MKVCFHLARPKSIADTAIVAVIRYSNERINFSTGISVRPKYWNKYAKEAKTIKGISNLELNACLNKTKNRIEEIFRRYINDSGNTPQKAVLTELLNKEFERKSYQKSSQKTFINFFEEIIVSSKAGTRLQMNGKTISGSTIKTYNTTIKHLKSFAEKRKKEMDFDNINLDFYHEYIEYLTKKLNLSPNAIGKDIQIIKLILREAFERGLTKNRVFENKRFSVMREQPDTIYLTKDELNELSNVDLKDNPRLEIIRDLFLIGCYTGMRYSDYTNISKEQIEDDFRMIRYKQCKTGKIVVLPVKREAKFLLVKYFDQLQEINELSEVKFNSKANAALKLIGQKCKLLQKNSLYKKTNGGITKHIDHAKWEKLSTHTARRTFATNELKDGTPISLIMAATGHLTEKAFWKYIRTTPEEKAKLLEIQWQKRENNLVAV